MSRSRERACLQSGLKLDINQLARNRLVRRGECFGPVQFKWMHPHEGEIARGSVTSDLRSATVGWLRIRLRSSEQNIQLGARSRHYGGYQWYFVCPVTGGFASVLWKLDGTNRFCSRKAWGRQVAYQSQFNTPIDRAHAGLARVKSRLIENLDPDEWELPPKPKWMRWATYDALVEKFDGYEGVLDAGLMSVVMKLGGC
jgi:hypothetical protein